MNIRNTSRLVATAVLLAIASPATAQHGHATQSPAPAPRPAFTSAPGTSATPHDVLRAYGFGANVGQHTGGPLTPQTGFTGRFGGSGSTTTNYPVFIGAPNTWFPSRTTGFSTAPLFPYASASFPYGYGYTAREAPEETQRKPFVPEMSVTPDPNSATMDVHVPADAQIWFEGSKTGQHGDLRTFVSPPLEPGRKFGYDIRARWTEAGKEIDETQHVSVRAGEHVQVEFGAKK
jgi:uncharacterized protein (TIGR03000 family)